MRATVVCVNHYVRLTLWKGEPEHRCTLRGGNLREHVIVGKVNLIVMRQRRLAFVREPACTLALVKYNLACYRHQRELSVVIYPRARLVRLLKAVYPVRGVGVLPSVAHLVCAWSPEIHTPWHGNGWVGVACRQFERRLRAHQRIHILHVVAFFLRICCSECDKQ